MRILFEQVIITHTQTNYTTTLDRLGLGLGLEEEEEERREEIVLGISQPDLRNTLTICGNTFLSPSATNVMALPFRPALPVRPILWI